MKFSKSSGPFSQSRSHIQGQLKIVIITIIILVYTIVVCRVDVERLREQGMYVLPWTVNDKEEKNYFRDKLKVPYVTDVVALDGDDTDITDSSLTH